MPDQDLPEPPVPPDTELRDLDGFMLNVERLLASELWALSSGEEFKAAVGLWCRAWKQVPAGSLPNDDRVLAAFSGAGKSWPKLKKMALRGFVLCSDGRLYHLVLCQDVERAAERKAEHLADREADRDRLRKWREAKRQKRQQGNAEETRVETDMKRVSKRAGNAHRNADETSNTGQGQGQGHYSDTNVSGPAAPSLGTIHPIDGDWSTPLFRQGVAYLASVDGAKPDSKRSLVGKWLKTCGQDHKRVFDLLAEAQRRAVADPEAWVTKALDQRADAKSALPFPGYVPMHPGAGG